MPQRFSPGKRCQILQAYKMQPGGTYNVKAHIHRCECGHGDYYDCLGLAQDYYSCGECRGVHGWVDTREEYGMASGSVQVVGKAEVEFVQPHLGRKTDLSPQEALEMAAEFCERNKMWPQPNARGYFDDSKISTTEKTTVVLRVAMFLIMGIDPNRIKDESFSFPLFTVDGGNLIGGQ